MGGLKRWTAALLNLSGLGLGYIYLRLWLIGVIYFFVTLILIFIAYLTNASNLPWLWIPLLASWLIWMAVDGWLKAKRSDLTSKKLTLLPGWKPLVGSLVILGLELGGVWGYGYLGRGEYESGSSAYQAGDCKSALDHLQRFTSAYELTFDPNIRIADTLIDECQLVSGAASAFQNSEYEEAAKLFETYLNVYPDSALTALAVEGVQQTYLDWAESLRQKSNYAMAIEKYQTISDHYATTDAGHQASNLVAETYRDWASSLCEQNHYQDGLDKYETLLQLENNPINEHEIQGMVSQAKWDWAGYLRDEHDYETALGKYEDLLDDKNSLYRDDQIRSASADTYAEWALYSAAAGSFDEAFEKCEILTDQFSDTKAAQEVGSLIGNIHLEKGNALLADHEFLEALEEFDLAKGSSMDPKVFQESYDKAISAIAQDSKEEGQALLNQAAEQACGGTGSQLPVFNILNEESKFIYGGDLFTLPADLIASKPGHLKYVVCAESGQKQIQRCRYIRTSDHAVSFLNLQQTWWHVWASDPETGVANEHRYFWGPRVGACPQGRNFSTKEESLTGLPPKAEDIIEWLRGLQ